MSEQGPKQERPYRTTLDMKDNDLPDEDLDDELPPNVSAHIEHLNRKWSEDGERHPRQQRHLLTRRRIEDWREERDLRRQFEDDDRPRVDAVGGRGRQTVPGASPVLD